MPSNATYFVIETQTGNIKQIDNDDGFITVPNLDTQKQLMFESRSSTQKWRVRTSY